jgi:hypothetical protein
MKNRRSVRSVRALAPAKLLFLLGLLIPGSVALSQPFPSFMLDSTIDRGPTFGDVVYSSVAFGPDLGLVVWVEGEASLWGARMDGNGVLLDSSPIDLRGPDDLSDVNMRPGVTWGGQRFLVVWTGGGRACCALVDEDGSVVERRVLQDDLAASQATSAAAAFDGVNFLATWLGYSGHVPLPGAFFARVSPQGVVLDSPPLRIAPGATIEQNNIALCFHDDRYMAVWTAWDTSGVWANFIMADGSTPDSVGFPIKTGIGSDYPSVTHDRNNFIVGWYEHHYKTRLARVTDGGQVLDPGGVLVDSECLWENAVFSIGDTTLVVDIRDSLFGLDNVLPMAVRVDTALRLLDSMPIPLSWPNHGSGGGPHLPALAVCGDNYVIAWSQEGGPGSGISNGVAWYRRLSRQGQLVDSAPMPATISANQQSYPKIATDGNDFLAAWADVRHDSGNRVQSIYAARLATDGSAGTPICLGHGTSPGIAYGGGCYLIVWKDDSTTLAARVTLEGVPLDSLPIVLSGPEGSLSTPTVAFGGLAFLVVWQDVSDNLIHGLRVTPSGTLLDSMPLLLQQRQSGRSRYPQVAFDGRNFLVVRNDASYPYAFRGTRVDTLGQLVDTIDIEIDETEWGSDAPRLTFGGGVYLMTSTRRHMSWRIAPSGAVLDSVRHTGRSALLAGFDGLDFVLACGGDSTGELGVLRLTTGGFLRDTTPVLRISSHSLGVSTTYASLAANGTGVTGLVFRSKETSPWHAYRVRAVTFPTLGIISQRDVAPPVALHVRPNPASRLATLSFNLTQAGPVRVTTFDAAGRRCATLFSGRMKSGSQTIPLDTRRLANGVYFLRLEAGAATHSTRLVVAR